MVCNFDIDVGDIHVLIDIRVLPCVVQADWLRDYAEAWCRMLQQTCGTERSTRMRRNSAKAILSNWRLFTGEHISGRHHRHSRNTFRQVSE